MSSSPHKDQPIERIRKYAYKRTNPRYRSSLWKKTPFKQWTHPSPYDQGFTDAMKQIAEYCDWLILGHPNDRKPRDIKIDEGTKGLDAEAGE